MSMEQRRQEGILRERRAREAQEREAEQPAQPVDLPWRRVVIAVGLLIGAAVTVAFLTVALTGSSQSIDIAAMGTVLTGAGVWAHLVMQAYRR